MSTSRKYYEIACDRKDQVDEISDLFKSKETLVNLCVYQTELKTYIILAEFSSPLKITITEEPFKGADVDKVTNFSKRCEECMSSHKQILQISQDTTKEKTSPKKVTVEKATIKKSDKLTTIEEKLDKIIELLEKLKK